ncbi:MAG: ATP synthase F1 subunit epsilon [Akkermansiaceae bacterium]|nr:ATP synthase F1 subunit epsilon [Akkermansiaceae bacterium]
MALHLKIITPMRTAVDTDVTSVLVPSAQGEMEVLPGHADIIAAMDNGELTYRPVADAPKSVFVGGGFLQVDGEDVMLVTDTVLEAHEIDASSIEAAVAKAQEAYRNQASVLSREESTRLAANIARQLAMLEYKRKKHL